MEVSRKHSPISHSDGDVIYHAITNALLLAIGSYDIGRLFPDNNKKYLSKKSAWFVEYALDAANQAGYRVNNITVMITAGEPKIGPYVDKIKINIATLLKIDVKRVGVGATSGERLSDTGKGRGIHADATVSLIKE